MNEINIYTDAGRCCRPIYNIENTNSVSKSIILQTNNGSINFNNLVVGSLLCYQTLMKK